MNRSNVIARAAVLAALVLAVSAPAALAQSASESGAPTSEAPTTTSATPAAAPAATPAPQDKATMKAEQDRQRALRSDTSANAISDLEAKQAADTAREKGQPVEEEEEGTR